MPQSTQASSPATTNVKGARKPHISSERSSSAGAYQVQRGAPWRQRRRGGASAKGNAVEKAEPDGGGEDEDNNIGAIRLDLNLEVDVTLKARLHGDLTLCLE
ncbi:hypothetical protein AB1N83_007526 [Pleurotus pulmonarius]